MDVGQALACTEGAVMPQASRPHAVRLVFHSLWWLVTLSVVAGAVAMVLLPAPVRQAPRLSRTSPAGAAVALRTYHR